MLSHLQLFVTPQTVAHQAPLSIGFCQQGYWSWLPFPPPGDLADPRIKLVSLTSPALAGGFLSLAKGFPGGSEGKHLPARQETLVQSLGGEDPLVKEMATHSSILAWRIPWMEESGRLQSTGLQRVRHNWVTSFSLLTWEALEKYDRYHFYDTISPQTSLSCKYFPLHLWILYPNFSLFLFLLHFFKQKITIFQRNLVFDI